MGVLINYKEYKIKFISGYTLAGALASIFTVGIVSIAILKHAPLFLVCIFSILFLFIVFLAFFYFNKLKVCVNDENITFKMPDKTTTFRIKDIYKIEKDFSYAGIGYYLFYYDDNHNKRHIKFDANLQSHEELIGYLQKKSGIKMRWEGTLDVENEKRPIVKGLKIIYNSIITLLIIGLVVVYPFMASSNREKERQQHLPERSLWP